MSIKYSVNLLDNDSYIRSQILSSLVTVLDKALIKTSNGIEPKVRVLLRSALQREPEYSSLISGELRREFGISDVGNVDRAIDNIVNTTNLSISKVKITGNGLAGGILLTVVPNKLDGIINDSSAFVVDSDRGYSLPWLEWLLTKGGQVIVRNFEVKYGSNPRSRSGDAIMVSSNTNWKVPSQYAGTLSDNWITRALSSIDDKIVGIIKTEMEAPV